VLVGLDQPLVNLCSKSQHQCRLLSFRCTL
jgi:hypothetical protein